jgi:hypothetical protein
MHTYMHAYVALGIYHGHTAAEPDIKTSRQFIAGSICSVDIGWAFIPPLLKRTIPSGLVVARRARQWLPKRRGTLLTAVVALPLHCNNMVILKLNQTTIKIGTLICRKKIQWNGSWTLEGRGC